VVELRLQCSHLGAARLGGGIVRRATGSGKRRAL